MSKNRLKKAQPEIRTREEMELVMEEITLTKLNEIKLTTQMDAEIAAVRARFEGPLGEIKEFLASRRDAAEAWSVANPQAFGKRKSIEFLQGTVGFRTGTPKLALVSRKYTWDIVLENVAALLPNFIRDKPEIDKEAIIAQHKDIGDEHLARLGLKVTQGESFFVEPNLTAVATKETAVVA